MNQIIQFPTIKTKPLEDEEEVVKSIEDVDNHMTIVRRYHVDETMAMLAENIFHNLMLGGFNIDSSDENTHKDIFLAMESLKSMLLKQYDIPHPLQKIAEDTFDRNEDGTYKLKVKNDTV